MNDSQHPGTDKAAAATGKSERFRKGDGNVIYANFGARAVADVAKNAKKTAPTRTSTKSSTWAARFLQQAAGELVDPGRLQRGRKYARDGHVLKLRFSPGAVAALVQGSQNEPFNTVMVLPPLSDDDHTALLTELATTPGAIQAVQMGVVSDSVGERLLTAWPHDIRFHCDCPDPAYPCKHVAALLTALATELDERPHRLLEIRGLTPAHIREQQRTLAEAKERENAAADSSNGGAKSFGGNFWGIRGDLPDLPNPKTASALEDTDMQLLQQAMHTVSYTNIDTIQAVSDLEDCFHFLITESDGPNDQV